MHWPCCSLPAGYGILVSSKVKETAASFTVRNPHEVQELLQGLVEWSETPDNGWRKLSKPLNGGNGAGAFGAVDGATGAGPRWQVGGPGTGHGGGEEQKKWQAWQQQVAAQQQQQHAA